MKRGRYKHFYENEKSMLLERKKERASEKWSADNLYCSILTIKLINECSGGVNRYTKQK